jgi:hypothetical protein
MLKICEGSVPANERGRPPERGYEHNANELPTFIHVRPPGLFCAIRGCGQGTVKVGRTMRG